MCMVHAEMSRLFRIQSTSDLNESIGEWQNGLIGRMVQEPNAEKPRQRHAQSTLPTYFIAPWDAKYPEMRADFPGFLSGLAMERIWFSSKTRAGAGTNGFQAPL